MQNCVAQKWLKYQELLVQLTGLLFYRWIYKYSILG